MRSDPQAMRAVLRRRFPSLPGADWQFSLTQGLSGDNWRAQNGDSVTILLRPITPPRRHLGIDRRREGRALRMGAAAGLGPTCYGTVDGWLLAGWLPGETLAPGALSMAQLAALVVRLHRLPPRLTSRSLRRYCAAYWAQLAPERRGFLAQRVHQRWQRRREPRPLKLALLHMDIHDGNLIGADGAVGLIDWEYAASGDIALDLAALSRNYALDGAGRAELVAAYCRQGGYRDAARLLQQLNRWLGWVDYMAWLWFELRWQQTQQPIYRRQADVLLHNLTQ
ncbi:phosphotransferase [Edwardsiella piscicida]|uniref:phosphotransferase n=1 Tax=Edwardsiella piscicida TaxID=1263550 RepID=UPI00370DDBAB